MSTKNERPKFKIFKRKNLLKNKVALHLTNNATGHLADEKIAEADSYIKEVCKGYNENITKLLQQLDTSWAAMQNYNESKARDQKAQEIFTIAHEIKDLSALCGYSLTAFFAESLRDYIAESAYNLKNQKIIITAHINALSAIKKNNIHDEADPAAEELKQMVKIAISKYK